MEETGVRLLSAFCVFQVANSATFGHLFSRDMLSPSVRERHRRILGDMLVDRLRAPMVDGA